MVLERAYNLFNSSIKILRKTYTQWLKNKKKVENGNSECVKKTTNNPTKAQKKHPRLPMGLKYNEKIQ